MKKENYSKINKLFIKLNLITAKSLAIIIFSLLFTFYFSPLASYGQGADCNSATNIALNNVTTTISINGNVIGSYDSGCLPNGGTILNEGWFKFTANTAHTAVTFLNQGSVTAYVYIYSGACGSLSYVTCMSVASGNTINLANFVTNSGSFYYIRIIKVDVGTVTGKVGVFRNTGTNASVCTPDKSAFSTGTASKSAKTDRLMTYGYTSGGIFNPIYSLGYAKFNTSVIPKTNTTINGIVFSVTGNSNQISACYDAGYNCGACVIKMKTGTLDPVTATGTQIYYQYTSGANDFFPQIQDVPYADNICTLYNTAITNFTSYYAQGWWTICLPVNWADGYGSGDYASFEGWDSPNFPYIVVTYTPAGCNPAAFSSQPASTSPLCAPANTTFSVTADGDPVISYLWQVNNGSWSNLVNGGANPGYAGVTTNTLSVSAANATLQYRCLAINCSGVYATSNAATLNVGSPPVISYITPPKPKCSRDTVLFKVIATGPALSYQWYKNNALRNGETYSSIIFSLLTSAYDGTYSCTVSNVCGNVSASTSLVVNSVPSLLDIYNDTTLCEGSAITFTIHPVGNDLSYQWKKVYSNLNIPGATTTVLNFPSLTKDDEEKYTVSACNNCGCKSITPFNMFVAQKPDIKVIPVVITKNIGEPVTFTISSGQEMYSYQWHKNNKPVSDITTINTFDINSVACSDIGAYSCVVSDACGSISPLVNTLYVNGCLSTDSIKGIVRYDKTVLLPIPNVWVFLLNSESVKIDSSLTDTQGAYAFAHVADGSYSLLCNTSSEFKMPWGGSGTTDALLVSKSFIKTFNIADNLRKRAADVDNKNGVSPTDALMINKRFIKLINHFAIPDWLFESPSVTVSGANVIQVIHAECAGDVDGSYPSTK